MAKKEEKKEFTFRYVYPSDLRDYYVNGAWGGVTPRREIHMHLFSERHPIPKSITHDVDDKGNLSKETKAEVGGDAVRLIQASVIMNQETAIAIRDWLSDKIKFTQKSQKEEKGK